MESSRVWIFVLKRCEIQGNGGIAAKISILKDRGEMLANFSVTLGGSGMELPGCGTSVLKRCEIQGKGGIAAKKSILNATGKWARRQAK